MIELIDGYSIQGKEYDYALVFDTGRKNKDGDTIYKNIGYYNTVESCIKACYRHLCRKATASQLLTMSDAVVEFQRIEKRLEKIIPDCFKR